MKLFFDPKTVALIGASATPFRPGNQLFQNLDITFGENFYPVNPRVDKIGDRPCWPTILDVPAEIDLAIIFINASLVPEALEQCAKKGVKRVIIESGGFAETGAEGRALHRRCLDIAKEHGIRLWGPNCMGLINVRSTKVLSFLMPMMWQGRFQPGDVSLVVQSGMLSAGFLSTILYKMPFGLSKVASIGNKMDVDEADVLEYLINDPETAVMAFYLEDFKRGRRFWELARKTRKPIVLLKSGRTEYGYRAAASHTAALAVDDVMVDAALRQAGVCRVYGMTELLEIARGLSVSGSKPVGGKRVGVISFSGGAGVVSSDEVFDNGLQLAKFCPETMRKLGEVFPDWMGPANPVDLYPAIEKHGPPKAMSAAIEAVMSDPQVDAVYGHLFAPPIKVPLFNYESINEIMGRHNKPLVIWIMGAGEGADDMRAQLEKLGVPVVDEIRRGVKLLAAITSAKQEG